MQNNMRILLAGMAIIRWPFFLLLAVIATIATPRYLHASFIPAVRSQPRLSILHVASTEDDDDKTTMTSSCHRRSILKATATMGTFAMASLADAAPPARAVLLCGCCTYDKPRNSYLDRFFAYSMSKGMEGYEAIARPYKTQLFEKLFNSLISTRNIDDYRPMTIVEVGMGIFPNAEYYAMKSASSLSLNIIGVDPNDYMSKYAQDSAYRAGLLSSSSSISSIRNVHGVAESLPFDSGSVDAVIGTLTLCTVVNQNQALSEIQRVLKPHTGRYLFWEHVLADDDNFLALQQRLLNPLQTVVADGCHLDRRTGENIRIAGFSGGVEMEYMTMALGGGGSSIIGSTIFGIAST